jgi:aryl-alcohol dehydrogenase-like predicted oxidoreductase
VDVYYIHAPDRRFPLKELLAGINALYKTGKFKRFGLSNYLAIEVDEVVRVCREKGYVLPSVY